MASLSKILYYTCYEMGHTWHHSCCRCSLEVCIIGFVESLRIYGVVYLISTLVHGKKLTYECAKQIIKEYLQSVIFLTVNAFGYIGFFCICRHLLQLINFATVSFMPGFLGSLAAILVERPSRRTLLCVYVTNVASVCLWNVCVSHGYVKPIPRGDILLFAASMIVFGYLFHSPSTFSPMINTALQFFLGSEESGKKIQERRSTLVGEESLQQKLSSVSWLARVWHILSGRHKQCPHSGSCVEWLVKTACRGFLQGFVLQAAMKILPSLPKVLRKPSSITSSLLNWTNLQAAMFVSSFTTIFKGVCCLGRWWSDEEKAVHGAVAGGLASASLYFYYTPSVVTYLFWKMIETLYEKGCDRGYLPRIPASIEFLYAVSTGYLFHISAVEQHNMKPSYWRFLYTLTWGRMAEFNRCTLDDAYGLDSSRNFRDFWPSYDLDRLSDKFKEKYALELAAVVAA